MKTFIAILSGCVFLQTTLSVFAGPEESVVKIIAAPTLPDPARPWAKPASGDGNGTGVIIDGSRILTNAHVVMYSPEVFVQARPSDEKFEAKIVAIDRDIDLAVLTVKDVKFFNKKPAVPRAGKLPRIQDPVTVFGFPIGGNDLSVTKGEISRIDFKAYGFRGTGTVIQISAAVNPGNSGGPALVGDKIVGIVQSYAAGTQNIGYIIPNEEIDIFLENLKGGRYAGKATDVSGTAFQTMENSALRRMLKVDATVKGVLVHPPRKPAADYPLKPFDIVTRIGEHEIDDIGKVQLANGRRAPFQYLFAKLAVENRVPLTVWRGGQQVRVPYPVTTRDTRLLPTYAGEPLAYFIHGPLVFATAKADDISLYALMNRSLYSVNSPLIDRHFEVAGFPGEELVVVSAPMFKHKLGKGYADPVGKVVETVNGTRIKNLSHLVEVLRDCRDELVTLRFADNYSEVLVFERQAMEKATEEILEDNGISSTRRGSADLLKLWKAKAAPPG
jgi:S1-C subfamily serine protease